MAIGSGHVLAGERRSFRRVNLGQLCGCSGTGQGLQVVDIDGASDDVSKHVALLIAPSHRKPVRASTDCPRRADDSTREHAGKTSVVRLTDRIAKGSRSAACRILSGVLHDLRAKLLRVLRHRAAQ